MRDDVDNSTLTDVADIQSGYPFRGPVREVPGGEAAVVQIKNVDVGRGIDWSGVVRTELEGRRKPDWLQEGDIVFTARGNRNAAAAVGQVAIKAVSSPHLFVIRLRRHDRALPEFIAWLMNQPEAQRYFAQSATGSHILNIRKDVLAQMPLRLPSLDKQRVIVQLDRAMRREKELLEQLIENRRTQLNLVARNLMD
jgi:hypothetical protein